MSSEITIDEITKNGVWIRFRNRLRFVFCDPEELTLMRVQSLENTRRSNKKGHHEPVVYYRDDEGRLCIPPSPEIPIPDGCERMEATTLKEVDDLCREVRSDVYRKLDDGTSFTDQMEDQLQNPRKQLLTRLSVSHSNMERDVIREIIKHFDQLESERSKIHADAYFGWRENDGGRR